MAVIGTVYKTEKMDGMVVHNVPHKKHDYPCYEGCCDNMLSIGAGTVSKVSWLLYEYMPINKLSEFDFDNWTEEMQTAWEIRLGS